MVQTNTTNMTWEQRFHFYLEQNPPPREFILGNPTKQSDGWIHYGELYVRFGLLTKPFAGAESKIAWTIDGDFANEKKPTRYWDMTHLVNASQIANGTVAKVVLGHKPVSGQVGKNHVISMIIENPVQEATAEQVTETSIPVIEPTYEVTAATAPKKPANAIGGNDTIPAEWLLPSEWHSKAKHIQRRSIEKQVAVKTLGEFVTYSEEAKPQDRHAFRIILKALFNDEEFKIKEWLPTKTLKRQEETSDTSREETES